MNTLDHYIRVDWKLDDTSPWEEINRLDTLTEAWAWLKDQADNQGFWQPDRAGNAPMKVRFVIVTETLLSEFTNDVP